MRVFLLLTVKYFYVGWILFVISLMFSPVISNAKFIPDVRIEHTPPATFFQGERIHLSARIADPGKVAEVRCYFKYESANPYLFVRMKPIEQGFECSLPVPASHVDRVEYVFVAVDALAQIVRSSVFYAPIAGSPKVRIKSFVPQQGLVTVKSELPISNQTAAAFASTDQPVYTVVSASKQYGLRAGIYDSAQAGYRYGLIGGLAFGLNAQYLSPTMGYQSFTAAVSSEVQVLFEQEVIATNYPDIDGANWSGYFYVIDNNGNLLSDKSPLTATVYHDGNGNVSIAISTHQCPGQDYFSHGDIDTSGFIHIYDDCDDELWTTYALSATSTHIQIMDFTDPPYYKSLNVVDLTRTTTTPPLAAPVLVSPADGTTTNSQETVLRWNAVDSAVNYQIRLGSTCKAGTVYATPSPQYTLTNLETDIVKYWQVRGQNAYAQWGQWSPCWSFTAVPPCLSCPAINVLLLNN